MSNLITLDKVPKDQLIYLAAPYSGTQTETDLRMLAFRLVDAQLAAEGYVTVSPLAKHFILDQSNHLGSDWAFWEHYSQVLLKQCHHVIVVMLPGWQESTGVTAELALAASLGIPVAYLKPESYLKVDHLGK